MGLETLLGIGPQGASTLIEGIQKAKQRRKALRALKELQARKDRDFATAETALRYGEAQFENDPRRAAVQASFAQRRANPDVISPGMLSILKQGAIDAAGRESGATASALRERAARSGLSYSGLGAGAEVGARSGAYGRAAGIGAQYDVEAAQKNKAARDSLEQEYADWLRSDEATRLGFGRDRASLYGSRDDSVATLLAGM